MSEMSQKRRALGRGLGALIVSTDPHPPATPPSEAAESAGQGGVRRAALSQISPNPKQPRTHFDETTLAELAASIRAHGIIQPLIVTANPHRAGDFWLVAGERRWRAAQLAGLQEAPVLVREASSQQMVEWALIENVQRADLNALEEANAYVALMEEFGLTQAEVADRVGKSRSAVANTVRLLQLDSATQSAVIDGRISPGHARSLLALPDQTSRVAALAEVLACDLNVRQTEALVKRLSEVVAKPPVVAAEKEEDPQLRTQIARIEDRFRQALGTRVNLMRNNDGSGKLVVHFFSDDELQNIYQMIAHEDHADDDL